MKRTVEVELLRPAQIIDERERTGLVWLPVGPLEWHGPHLPLGTDPLRARLAALSLAQSLGGVVMPTLYMGTERERSPKMLESIGFASTDWVVGMDFPANTLKSLYAREEVFALALREQLELVIGSWGFRRLVIVNGHGAENHLATIQRLCRELEATRAVRVVLVMPMLGFPEGGWGHASLEETETLLPYYPDSVDVAALPPGSKPLANTGFAVVDDKTFRGQPTADHTVRPEEDPRRADVKRGQKVFSQTLVELESYLRRELGLPA